MLVAFLPAQLVDQIGWLLIHSLWQFTLIAVAVAVILRALHRAAANVRYATGLVGLAAMVVVPMLTYLILPANPFDREAIALNFPLATGSSQWIEVAAPPADERARISIGPVTPAVTESTAPWWTSLDTRIAPWLEELVAAWCLGVLMFGLRPGWSWVTVRRLRQRGVSAVPPTVAAMLQRVSERLGMRRACLVQQSKLVLAPMVVG